jgi:hypothetical protein
MSSANLCFRGIRAFVQDIRIGSYDPQKGAVPVASTFVAFAHYLVPAREALKDRGLG